MEFNYEKLEVSKLANELIRRIYKITEDFPKEEMYCLVSQIRRAVISVLLNIAEGSSKDTKKDFKRFVRIAIGSLVETDCALKIGFNLGYLDEENIKALEPLIKELYFKLIGLIKYLSQ